MMAAGCCNAANILIKGVLVMMNVVKMLVLALAGVILLIYPVASLHTAIVILGIALIGYGAASCLAFIMERAKKEQEEKKRTVLSFLIGILALACGIFAVVKPETVAQYFPILAGLLVLSIGILRSAETIVHKKEFAAWKPVLAVSLATIVLGAILLFCNFDQQTTVRMLGTVMLYLGATGAVETGSEKK
jgi:uncharacterized membrane protein HdeD (DUF308 family)